MEGRWKRPRSTGGAVALPQPLFHTACFGFDESHDIYTIPPASDCRNPVHKLEVFIGILFHWDLRGRKLNVGKEEKLPSQVLKVQIGSLKRRATGIFILLQLLLEDLERTKHSTQYFVKTCCRHVLGGFHSINSCTIRKPHCLGGGGCAGLCRYTCAHAAVC